jgi:hypothetical protein
MNTTDKAILVTGANRAVVQLLAEEALRREAKEGRDAVRSVLMKAAKDVAPLPLDAMGAFQIGPFPPACTAPPKRRRTE